MFLREEDRKIIRECKLEWHCHLIKITQPLTEDGYLLNGYGVIKIHESGGIYLDFICMESNRKLGTINSIPNDTLDKKQCLVMNASTIDGCNLTAQDFRIKTDAFDFLSDEPKFYRIWLNSIEINEDITIAPVSNSYLHLEFNEKCMIPYNKFNKTESSLGTKTISRNQATIKYENFEIDFIEHKKYTEVYVRGEESAEPSEFRDVILFYLGFSSGALVQPYFERLREPNVLKTVIYSIDRKKLGKHISPPTTNLVHDKKTGDLAPFHLDLLLNIFKVSKSNHNYFESIYSQWSRIWHSFLSVEFSVSMLTVSVAVEGILNDIFIPVIENDLKDNNFEEEKTKVLKIIGELEGISPDHIKSIQDFIGKWGNIYAKKALQYLIEKEVVERFQLTCWEKLRNHSAHPKLLKQDEARKRKNIERTIVCLGLFYRLVMNVFSYKGAQYAYEKLKDEKLVVYEHINILKIDQHLN